ncbi:MAG: hypothetical protein LBC27_06805 [Spirochaetaceae bacterium]|nr:hypothetical protein [Spirochaetaceae bacterium]
MTIQIVHNVEISTGVSDDGKCIGNDYGVGKSAVCETIQRVENTLIKDKTFRLPDKKVLKRGTSSIEYIVVDVTESPINRPKKTKKSGIPARKSVIR